MKEIQLTQGKIALVDDENYEYLNQWKWYARKSRNNNYYAGRYFYIKKGFRIYISMHTDILNPNKQFIIDHINNNGLDNRKINLRICTNAENMKNRPLYKNNSSGFKGVNWSIKSKKWYAYIRNNKIMYNLGCYINVKDAAKAYNNAAIKFHGEFANLNKIH